jgi:hypothetical protein
MTLQQILATAGGLLATLATLAAQAQAPTPAELDRALAGRWQGHLEYRDYQNDRRYQLPMQSEIEIAEDGATITRRSRFDDGPARGNVLITTVSLYDAAGRSVTAASFRRGRAVETITEEARVVQHTGATQWTAEWLRRGIDGDQPSDIRITVARRGDELRAVKEVRAVRAVLAEGEAPAPWVFRNETVLRRAP